MSNQCHPFCTLRVVGGPHDCAGAAQATRSILLEVRRDAKRVRWQTATSARWARAPPRKALRATRHGQSPGYRRGEPQSHSTALVKRRPVKRSFGCSPPVNLCKVVPADTKRNTAMELALRTVVRLK